MLKTIADEVWVADQPLKFFGLALGARMTVIRLPDGHLWIHSPIRLDEELQGQLRALGPVGFLVAPSKVHHLFIKPYIEAFPDAQVYVAPGLPKKREDLASATVLGSDPPEAWSAVIEQQLLLGAPYMNEVVFFHRPSESLLVTDLMFNISEARGWWTRNYLRWMGALGGPRQSKMVRYCTRDRHAMARSLDRVFEWPFSRVVGTHGDVLETDAKSALGAACAWFGGAES